MNKFILRKTLHHFKANRTIFKFQPLEKIQGFTLKLSIFVILNRQIWIESFLPSSQTSLPLIQTSAPYLPNFTQPKATTNNHHHHSTKREDHSRWCRCLNRNIQKKAVICIHGVQFRNILCFDCIKGIICIPKPNQRWAAIKIRLNPLFNAYWIYIRNIKDSQVRRYTNTHTNRWSFPQSILLIGSIKNAWLSGLVILHVIPYPICII